MPRGKPGSPLSRAERLDKAFDYFRMGYSDADVARRLKLHPDTIASYRRKFEDRIQDAVRERPELLNDVLGNTYRVLDELNMVIKDAWKRIGRKRVGICQSCYEECGHDHPLAPSAVAGFHNIILKATEDRIKVYGLLGVKQEYFMRVQQIEQLQRRILDFMAGEFCEMDRRKLANFMAGLAGETPELPPIDVEAISEELV